MGTDADSEPAGVGTERRGSVTAPSFVAGGGGATRRGAASMASCFQKNQEVVKAVQDKVEETVDLCHNYRHAVWYMVFVAVYLVVLYFQATSFQSAAVVATLKGALLDDPTANTMSFSSSDQVLAYIGNRAVAPVFTDPVCGDGRCEAPWEFPAWGPFGCRADCGVQPNTTNVLVAVTGDFMGHASLSPRMLMAHVRWNLCLDDTARRKRGLPDLCWFQDDQTFAQYQETQIQAVNLAAGMWYVRVLGDFAGRVSGAIYDATDQNAPQKMPVQPVWDSCASKRQAAAEAAAAAALRGSSAGRRRLHESYGRLRDARGEEGTRALLERALWEGVARANSGGAVAVTVGKAPAEAFASTRMHV